jgi:predicted SnoaL-like aldol condensation-catalyzing enzyme
VAWNLRLGRLEVNRRFGGQTAFSEGDDQMRIMKKFIVLAALVGFAADAAAQQAPRVAFPAAGCTATPVQLDANKKAAMAFFRPGITPEERATLLDQGYIQHNPAFKKFADENKISYFEGFKQMMGRGGGGGRQGGGAAGPQPPQGNPTEIVVAECDLVTVIHKNYRQDPTAAPGTWFEAFTFDTFRVQNGKLIEHWDSAVINPPAPPAAVK